mmetsp:Transcript_100366/g.289837  ORF Transcript_100366/g.289837 Transcript_100366/m.289837 type:complete len:293 (-) Transcript_100366:548-1426(-)
MLGLLRLDAALLDSLRLHALQLQVYGLPLLRLRGLRLLEVLVLEISLLAPLALLTVLEVLLAQGIPVDVDAGPNSDICDLPTSQQAPSLVCGLDDRQGLLLGMEVQDGTVIGACCTEPLAQGFHQGPIPRLAAPHGLQLRCCRVVDIRSHNSPTEGPVDGHGQSAQYAHLDHLAGHVPGRADLDNLHRSVAARQAKLRLDVGRIHPSLRQETHVPKGRLRKAPHLAARRLELQGVPLLADGHPLALMRSLWHLRHHEHADRRGLAGRRGDVVPRRDRPHRHALEVAPVAHGG